MLIRWMMAQTYSPRKVVVFVVPKVALINQQVNFIKAQTGLECRGYSGMAKDALGRQIDTWDLSQWQSAFNSIDVLVMTRSYRSPSEASFR